jgi:hypothetical protein
MDIYHRRLFCPRFPRRAVVSVPVPVSFNVQQYCPELRIPLNLSTGPPCLRPGRARAVGPDTAGAAGNGAVFAGEMFMALFLFTMVNTGVWAGQTYRA